MSFDAAQTLIEERFKTTWGSRSPVIYENMDWPDPEEEAHFVRLAIVEAPSSKIELRKSPALVRFSGTIFLQVFVVKGKGVGETPALGDFFASNFELACFKNDDAGLVRTRTVDKVPIGESGNSGWYQTNFRCPYIRDVFKQMAD